MSCGGNSADTYTYGFFREKFGRFQYFSELRVLINLPLLAQFFILELLAVIFLRLVAMVIILLANKYAFYNLWVW